MNKTRTILQVFLSLIHLWIIKILHIKSAKVILNKRIKLGSKTRITIRRHSILKIRGKFITRNNVELIVGEEAYIEIGDRVLLNSNCILSARKGITIGNNVQFGPHCLVYDNDHDYQTDPRERSQVFQCSNIVIGDDVWIGGNTVILRGTVIGNNCVIGAGSIVKGEIPDNCVFIQKREFELKKIHTINNTIR